MYKTHLSFLGEGSSIYIVLLLARIGGLSLLQDSHRRILQVEGHGFLRKRNILTIF